MQKKKQENTNIKYPQYSQWMPVFPSSNAGYYLYRILSAYSQ